MEDWPAEVPNPHTLLTNVPSAANYFTVIDLCSVFFFSVPLAEESQPLFAFTYQAPDVSFTKAMGKLKNLREEVTKNAGADMHTWDWFNSLFGSWGQWLTKMGIVVMFLLLFCCIVPFIRSMLASATAKQMINVSVRPTGIDVGCTNMYTVGPGLDELDEFV